MSATTDSFIQVATKITETVVQHGQTSLAQFVRPTLIESPCFIQDSIVEENVLNDILKNLYNVYVGYIITALQMNAILKDGRKVKDIISTVSTSLESLEAFIDVRYLVDGLSTEAVDPYNFPHKGKNKPAPTPPPEKDDPLKIAKTPGKANEIASENKGKDADDDKSTKHHGVGGGKLALDKVINVSIASGRQIELEFAIPGQEQPFKLLVTCKFNPRVIPTAVAEYLMEQDLSQPLVKRWTQFQAGEISFFKDFVFGMDKLERREKALKADKDGALQDLFYQVHKSKIRQVVRAINTKGDKPRNIANSVIILDENSVNRFTKRTGFRFSNVMDRRHFFDNTYSLFIVLVDTSYSKATIYTNGLDQSATYSFNELKASAASDKMSIKDVLDYLSKNQMPKF
jgi:hypothetical protein